MKQLKLQLPKLPRSIGELTHSNQILKFNVVFAYTLAFSLIVLLFAVLSKPPLVLTLTPSAAPFEEGSLPKPEEEIKRAARAYIAFRYRWDPKSVEDQLQRAKFFIPLANRKMFDMASANIAKFALQKGVTQRAYPVQIVVDLEKKVALVIGDRVTAIQGLNAAGELRLELSFDGGPRTKENPWGVYFTKEKEQ